MTMPLRPARGRLASPIVGTKRGRTAVRSVGPFGLCLQNESGRPLGVWARLLTSSRAWSIFGVHEDAALQVAMPAAGARALDRRLERRRSQVPVPLPVRRQF